MSIVDPTPSNPTGSVVAETAPTPAPSPEVQVNRGLPFWANPRFGLAILIVVALAVFSTLDSKFLNVEFVLFPALRTVAILSVVGMAQMIALSIGHMNLAVGRMAGFGAMFMGIDALPIGEAGGAQTAFAIGSAAGMVTLGWFVNSGVLERHPDLTVALIECNAGWLATCGHGTALAPIYAAHAAGIWIGMCGELAGNALAAPVLVGLGLDELSMSAPSIPAVKAAVRRFTLADARRIAAAALALDSAEAVARFLQEAQPSAA